MKKIEELKAQIAEKKSAYQTLVAGAHLSDDARALTVEIDALTKAVSDTITEGAKPCPVCEQPPLGIEHPTTRGGVEYEIGCLGCGSAAAPHARGGTLPRHAVELWNELVDAHTPSEPDAKAAS